MHTATATSYGSDCNFRQCSTGWFATEQCKGLCQLTAYNNIIPEVDAPPMPQTITEQCCIAAMGWCAADWHKEDLALLVVQQHHCSGWLLSSQTSALTPPHPCGEMPWTKYFCCGATQLHRSNQKICKGIAQLQWPCHWPWQRMVMKSYQIDPAMHLYCRVVWLNGCHIAEIPWPTFYLTNTILVIIYLLYDFSSCRSLRWLLNAALFEQACLSFWNLYKLIHIAVLYVHTTMIYHYGCSNVNCRC